MRNRIPGLRRPWRGLRKALLGLAAGQAELLRHVEQPWASVTFAGTRHTVVLAFAGTQAVVAGEHFIAALPEHEFAIPGQIVADAVVASVDHDVLAQRLTVELDLLLLEEV